MRAVLRYEIRIDDEPHGIPHGRVVLFGRSNRNRRPGFEDRLDVWVEVDVPDGWPVTAPPLSMPVIPVRVFETGQGIPTEWGHVASYVDGELVWHLYVNQETL